MPSFKKSANSDCEAEEGSTSIVLNAIFMDENGAKSPLFVLSLVMPPAVVAEDAVPAELAYVARFTVVPSLSKIVPIVPMSTAPVLPLTLSTASTSVTCVVVTGTVTLEPSDSVKMNPDPEEEIEEISTPLKFAMTSPQVTVVLVREATTLMSPFGKETTSPASGLQAVGVIVERFTLVEDAAEE